MAAFGRRACAETTLDRDARGRSPRAGMAIRFRFSGCTSAARLGAHRLRAGGGPALGADRQDRWRGRPYPERAGAFHRTSWREGQPYRLRAEGHGTTGNSTIPSASARCWARWTNTCWARARIGGCGRCSARMRSRMRAWTACISPSGRRMRERVSVVGDFNIWDGRRHPMRRRGATGVWEIFIPGLGEGTTYKYEITGPDGDAAAAQGRSGRVRV